ncbi:hypothetical protein AMJ44_12565 [candidate division WOR-1 bacterium DG_54_3]|uniref:AbiV family abortive infection protein n=1 Tax=candidate division WOR-1 bacterium DG_54_3 TaxID=1703775 RepID=A0A0S7XQ08_UNCSA|nr:MAG: hypothetical protein AMJ44_12565 [candidate division WOR-1 bacterium DG_54_3]
MVKKKLDQYRGKLSPAQISQGMNAAISNAKRLADDAELLLKERRFPSAASLAVLSIEESGKLSILRQLAVVQNDKQVIDSWRQYRSHTKKNVAWILPDLVKGGSRKLDDLKPIFDESSDHPYVLDHIKQIGFYTDCLGKAHWSVPDEVIDEKLAGMLVAVAKLFVSKKEVTEKEMELWIKHVGPVWMKNMEWMKHALENWYQDMQKSGLAPEGSNAMQEFIRKGIDIDTDKT